MGSPRHILFYDGVCGMCDRIVQFVLARDRKHVFQFAALQSAFAARQLGPFGKDVHDLDTVYVLVDAGSDGARVLDRGRAILFVLRQLGGVWGILGVMGSIFPRVVADFFYRRVAASRYRIFGKLDACRVPSPEERTRFLEQ
jgi:predicted DCC family thiol-disulfide oxidoreductase YuxK